MSRGAGIDLLREDSVVIDYTSLDYEALLADLQVFAQTRFSDRWTNFNDDEFAVIFLSIQSYIGDLLTFHFNTVIAESNPLTAQRRQNFINAGKAYDFTLLSAVASTVDELITSDPAELPYLLRADTFKAATSAGITFMPVTDTLVTTTPQTVGFVEGDLQLNEQLGVSDGSPNQDFFLDAKPLIDTDPSGVTTLVVTVDSVQWARRTNVADAQSTDEIYFTETDEDDETQIIFGDNINGKIPANGGVVRATYKIGAGVLGSNANPETIETISTPQTGLLSISNVLAASGGSPKQTLNQGKTALPASIATQRRAVTTKDYADILFTSDSTLTPPTGVAKASSVVGPVSGGSRQILVFVAPNGAGAPSVTLKSNVSSFLAGVKEAGRTTGIRDPVYINSELEIDAFIDRNFRQDDVVTRLRTLLITEDVASPSNDGIFDFENVGFGARDDDEVPQITQTRLNDLFGTLRDLGLQKGVITKLSTVSVLKEPRLRVNSGNGVLTSVTKNTDAADPATPRREWVLRFTSATAFNVFQRITGFSTFISDDTLIDDRLNLEDLGYLAEIASILPTGSVINPNRGQEITFVVDLATSTGNTVKKTGVAAGSIFGVAATGDEYFIEFQDGSGTLATPYVASSSPNLLGNVTFLVNAGTVTFTAGDEVSFDVFPLVGDVLLREDEIPQYARNTSNVATALIITARTAL